MTSPLLAVFVDAYLAERKTYRLDPNDYYVRVSKLSSILDFDPHAPVEKSSKSYEHHGTRADCERFIAERATVAGMRAVRDTLPPTRDAGLDAVEQFLNELIGDEGMTKDFEDYDPEIKTMDDMYQAAKAIDMDALNRVIKWLLDTRKEDFK